MNTKIFTIASLLVVALLSVSCHSHSQKTKDSDKEKTEVSNKAQFVALVEEWNKANSSKDIEALRQLFDDDVIFYGSKMSKDACMDDKMSLFKKKADFYQQIYGDVEVETISATEVKCIFVKRVTVGGQTTDYPSYLNFRKIGGKWKISVEGDLVTDKILADKSFKSKYANLREYQFNTPSSVVYGTVVTETYYGPPGYGEDPKHDSKERFYMLLLDKPIDVIADFDDEFSTTTNDITKIQLVPNSDMNNSYVNKFVKLTGDFFYWHTGHHHTEVLLDVERAEIIEQ